MSRERRCWRPRSKHRRDKRRKSRTTATLLAAGDIASCSSSGDEATAKLLDTLAGKVATLGDNVYESGTASEFSNCYKPTWGRHKSRTRPAVGNHEYLTSGASRLLRLLWCAAGDPKKGYYSYELGAWHIVVLNSNCSKVGRLWCRLAARDLAAPGSSGPSDELHPGLLAPSPLQLWQLQQQHGDPGAVAGAV